jgi:hypothetical protein
MKIIEISNLKQVMNKYTTLFLEKFENMDELKDYVLHFGDKINDMFNLDVDIDEEGERKIKVYLIMEDITYETKIIDLKNLIETIDKTENKSVILTGLCN